MLIRYIDDSPAGKARVRKIKKLLPKESLVETMLMPKLENTYPLLMKMLYAELEIYRAYPKKPLDESGKAKVALKTFDPRNHTTCFQGKAFTVTDSEWGDADLANYRKAIGTFHHSTWGNTTLLEIWGADHMQEHTKMVQQAFKYGANLIKTRPVLKFFINPLFRNLQTGKYKLTDDQKIHKYDMDLLLAKAMLWGTRTHAQSVRANNNRSARNFKIQEREDEKYLESRKKEIGV